MKCEMFNDDIKSFICNNQEQEYGAGNAKRGTIDAGFSVSPGTYFFDSGGPFVYNKSLRKWIWLADQFSFKQTAQDLFFKGKYLTLSVIIEVFYIIITTTAD